MDEVFDLKQKNMWFRSRFVSILKRFLHAFMGDSVNRFDHPSIQIRMNQLSDFTLVVLPYSFNIGHQHRKLLKK